MFEFPRYRSYRSSGVDWIGDIPEHWEISPGLTCYEQKKELNTGMIEDTVLSISYGRIVIKLPEELTGLVPESFETYQLVEPGDIIVRPTDLQNDWNTLRTAISRHRGIITSAYLRLRAKEMNTEYLRFVLHTYDLLKVFYGMGSGLRQNLDYSGDFKRLPIIVPPRDEQDRIVDFLNRKTEEIRRITAKKQRLIGLLREQKAALIQRFIYKGLEPNGLMKASGIDWVGDIPAHWNVQPGRTILEEHTELNDGLNENTVLSLSYGQIVVKPEEKLYGLVPASFETYQIVQPGDIVVRGMDLQNDKTSLRVGLVRDRGIITSAYLCLRPENSVLSAYVYHLLHCYDLNKVFYGMGSGLRQNLSYKDFKYIPLLIPPIEEQSGIVSVIADATSEIDMAIQAHTDSISLVNEYGSVLVTEAVTGKIKL